MLKNVIFRSKSSVLFVLQCRKMITVVTNIYGNNDTDAKSENAHDAILSGLEND